MQDSRRFVLTAWKKVGNAIVPVRGHFIGGGPSNILTLHRRLQDDLMRQLRRHAAGRHVWWPNLFKQPEPWTQPDTRQHRRHVARVELKLALSAMKKQARANKRGGYKHNRPATEPLPA